MWSLNVHGDFTEDFVGFCGDFMVGCCDCWFIVFFLCFFMEFYRFFMGFLLVFIGSKKVPKIPHGCELKPTSGILLEILTTVFLKPFLGVHWGTGLLTHTPRVKILWCLGSLLFDPTDPVVGFPACFVCVFEHELLLRFGDLFRVQEQRQIKGFNGPIAKAD